MAGAAKASSGNPSAEPGAEAQELGALRTSCELI